MNDGLLLLAGLALLIVGGEVLVRGATGLALLARVTPAVAGLTIVAAGTSAPELVVSLRSALAGEAGLAVGNVVGSNLFNIGVILGLSALLGPLAVRSSAVRLEWPAMLAATLGLAVVAWDGIVGRAEGAVLLVGLVAFTVHAVRLARREAADVPLATANDLPGVPRGRTGAAAVLWGLGAVLVGMGLLAFGASLLVDGAVGIARSLAVPETVIGLTIVGAGTSTPELVTSLMAARRGQADIAIGNVLGSNLFNILGIVGVTACALPLEVPAAILHRDLPWLLGACLLLLPLMRTGQRLTRGEGLLLLAGFAAYLIVLLLGLGAGAPG